MIYIEITRARGGGGVVAQAGLQQKVHRTLAESCHSIGQCTRLFAALWPLLARCMPSQRRQADDHSLWPPDTLQIIGARARPYELDSMRASVHVKLAEIFAS